MMYKVYWLFMDNRKIFTSFGRQKGRLLEGWGYEKQETLRIIDRAAGTDGEPWKLQWMCRLRKAGRR